MLRGSASFERAVSGSHAAGVKAECWQGLSRVGEINVVSGSVSDDASQFVRRTTSLVVKDDDNARAWLWSPGMTVRVWRSARSGGNYQALPVHWGLSLSPERNRQDGTISLSSPDVSMRVSLDRFTSPRTTSAGVTVVEQISMLLRESVPWATIEDETDDATPCASATWAQDRNQAIMDLATSIGSEVYWRPDGVFVIRRVRNLLMPADWTVVETQNLTAGSDSADMSKSFNVIVASGDSTSSGSSSVWAISQDADPASPTYIGTAGRVVGFYSSSLLASKAQAQTAADSIRYRTQGAQVSVAYGGILHPGLGAGDRHDVSFGSRRYRVVCDSLSWDLFGNSATGSARSATLPPAPDEVS